MVKLLKTLVLEARGSRGYGVLWSGGGVDKAQEIFGVVNGVLLN